jgi:hypothetical protein
MNRRLGLLLVTVSLTLIAAPAMAAAVIELDDTYPLLGEPVQVRLSSKAGPATEATLRVTYRPNSATVFTETIAAGPGGALDWTPRDAGIVRLELLPGGPEDPPLVTRNVAVRFASPPASGLAVMAVAGLLLFGGAGFAFYLLLSRSQPPEAVEAEPPST